MKEYRVWVRAALYGVLSLVFTLLLLLAAAKLLESGTLPFEFLYPIALVVTAVAVLGGCLISALTAKQNRLPLTAVTGLCFFLLLCGMNALLFDGDFQTLLPTAGIILGAVLLASLLAARKRSVY